MLDHISIGVRDLGKLVAVASVAAVTGCASLQVTDVSDLEFAGIEVVRSGASDLAPEVREFAGSVGQLLRITVTTTADLADVARRNHLRLFGIAALCPIDGGTSIRVGVLGVFREGIPVGHGDVPHHEREQYRSRLAQLPVHGRYRYQIFALTSRSTASPNVPELRPFDLRESGSDVCVQLAGARMLLPGFRSNIVVIPGREIARLLVGTL